MAIYDTIIVGMGAAGCSAASVLCKAGKRVLALEAQNRVGGRVNTVPFGSGVVELGAEWVHGEVGNSVNKLAVEHSVPLLPHDITLKFFRSDRSDTGSDDILNDLVEYAFNTVDDHPKEPEPLGQYLTRRLKEYIATKYPELLNDKYLIDNILHFIDLFMNNYNATNSWDDLTTHGNYKTLEGDQHLSFHKNGYKTVFEVLLNTYQGASGYPNLNIRFEKVVTKIKYPQDPVQDVEVTCKDGSTYKGRNVIVTVSLGVLKESHASMFYPPLPDSKATVIDKMSIGVMDKIVLLFPEAWFPKDRSFFAFIWSGDERSKIPLEDFWVTKIFGCSNPKGSDRALTLWTSGNVAKVVETLPEDLVRRKCMELLRRFMGKGVNIPEPIDIIRSNWHTNPYTRGSFTYDNLQTHQYPNARAILAEPLVDCSGAPRVLFAGEATDNVLFSTVHGAMDSGRREANRLLSKSKL
ncbi:unnamed protein product [Arctia plantaginis]|uniref:Amine oxidase domain-containing protein n=1 Tax=Arctia plantaginis TaxID=874455 RepID=A0A8S1BFY4_ARCPL|nr:unnamed protein product [Arctia plantaginis]